MSSKKYFPSEDGSFDAWFNQFRTAFQNYYKTFGFSKSDVAKINSAYYNWSNAYWAWTKAWEAYNSATTFKKSQRKYVESLLGPYFSKLYKSKKMTPTYKSAFGFSTFGNGKFGYKVPKTAPTMKVDWSKKGKVQIWVGSSGGSKSRKGTTTPPVLLQFRIGGGDWQYLAVTNQWPFWHVVGNASKSTIQYRCAYLNSKGKPGPWSEVATAFVAAA
ncbi:MAG TPA: hypothetical protein VNK96_07650 [Fimbriimonadales bacterium]|nr:hypothetical protein [Fimbriimonadales bacterium]